MRNAVEQVERWLGRIHGDRPPAVVLGGSCNGLSFARSLGRRGIPVLMLESEPLLGIYTRFADVAMLPPVDRSADEWLELLESVGARLSAPAILFSTSDALSLLVARNSKSLSRYFRFLIPDASTLEKIINKRWQYQIAREAGVPIPATQFPESVDQADEMSEAFSYPCLLKPYESHAARGKLTQKAVVVRSQSELIASYERISAMGVPLMIQEIIPGPDSALFGYLAFWDRDGRERAWLTKQKLRQFPSDIGDGSYQVTVDAPEVADMGRRLLGEMNYRGFAGVEAKFDARDGSYRLMELNARTVSGNQMAIDAGVDFPWLGYQYLTGVEEIPACAFQRNVRYVNEEWDIQAFGQLRRSKQITLPQWVGSLCSAKSWSIGAADDPRPLVMGMARIAQGIGAGLPILMFHSIDYGDSPLCFPPPQFRRAMRRLRDKGYRTIRLAELAEAQRTGQPLPFKTVVLTFDDGHESVYKNAWPVLYELGMTATVFLLPARTDHEGMPLLSWDQIRELQSGGIDFGAHSLTHPDMPKLSDSQIEQEMIESKRLIEEKLQSPIASFAYPFGRYDQRCCDIAKRHFQCACCDDLGLMDGQSNPFAFPRVETYYLRSGKLFDLMFTPAFPWYLRARNVPRRLKRALRSK